MVGILLASGLLLAILTLYFQKGLTILGTAISGGAIMSATLDYFIEKVPGCVDLAGFFSVPALSLLCSCGLVCLFCFKSVFFHIYLVQAGHVCVLLFFHSD